VVDRVVDRGVAPKLITSHLSRDKLEVLEFTLDYNT
jgi:hypothetical protein